MCYWDRKFTYPKMPGKNFDLIAIRGRVAIWEPRRCSPYGQVRFEVNLHSFRPRGSEKLLRFQMEGKMASIRQSF